jgi:hypothetical protein
MEKMMNPHSWLFPLFSLIYVTDSSRLIFQFQLFVIWLFKASF